MIKILILYFLILFNGIVLGRAYEKWNTLEVEQHDLCYDTAKYEAWVAKKNGMYRCFMEYKNYPHRVRASHIDYDSQE